jgi:hypothetical protein
LQGPGAGPRRACVNRRNGVARPLARGIRWQSMVSDSALIEPRQSETALLVRRGVQRLLRAHSMMSVAELTLPSGRRADLVAVSVDGRIDIIEIKSSVADVRADEKWPHYRRHCDRLFFAIPPAVPVTIIPADVGLIVADCYGAEILREAPQHAVLAAASRRAVVLRFAQVAAQRLHDLHDPNAAAISM